MRVNRSQRRTTYQSIDEASETSAVRRVVPIKKIARIGDQTLKSQVYVPIDEQSAPLKRSTLSERFNQSVKYPFLSCLRNIWNNVAEHIPFLPAWKKDSNKDHQNSTLHL